MRSHSLRDKVGCLRPGGLSQPVTIPGQARQGARPGIGRDTRRRCGAIRSATRWVACVLADFRNPSRYLDKPGQGARPGIGRDTRRRCGAIRSATRWVACVLADFRNPVLFGLILAEQPNNFTTWHGQEKGATSCDAVSFAKYQQFQNELLPLSKDYQVYC